jgi:hypothetical protein
MSTKDFTIKEPKNSLFLLKTRISGFFKAEKEFLKFKRLVTGNFINSYQKDGNINLEKSKDRSIDLKVFCNITSASILSREKYFFKAKYFFSTNHLRPFRTRIYCLKISKATSIQASIIEMDILRNESVFNSFDLSKFNNDAKRNNLQINTQSLIHCRVNWVPSDYKIKDKIGQETFYGFISYGGCTISSEQSLEFVHIKDELILGPHFFWVNDKAFFDDGNLIYGDLNDLSFQFNRLTKGDYFICEEKFHLNSV